MLKKQRLLLIITIKQGVINMNIKKIGLTALAGSLVATSAFAGAVSVSGGASFEVQHVNGVLQMLVKHTQWVTALLSLVQVS